MPFTPDTDEEADRVITPIITAEQEALNKLRIRAMERRIALFSPYRQKTIYEPCAEG